jgi:hypothetical protein
MDTDAAPPCCTICRRPLYADELGRYACRPCTQRVDQNLRTLAGPPIYQGQRSERKLVSGFYAALSDRLTPGRGGDGACVSGSRTAPIPVRLDVLNLMTAGGPVLGPLETWVRDWETYGRAELREAGTLQQRVDHAVGTLRFNLEWAATRHAAVDEFAREVGLIHRQCEGQVSGERPPRRVPVACPCGQTLRVTLDTDRARCPGCSTEYGHSELMNLPFAGQRAAA